MTLLHSVTPKGLGRTGGTWHLGRLCSATTKEILRRTPPIDRCQSIKTFTRVQMQDRV